MSTITYAKQENGANRASVVCDTCQRSQTVGWNEKVSEYSAAHFVTRIGWAQTEKGWLCPFHSDAGPSALMEIFEKTR